MQKCGSGTPVVIIAAFSGLVDCLFMYLMSTRLTGRRSRREGLTRRRHGGVKDPCGNAWWISTIAEEIVW